MKYFEQKDRGFITLEGPDRLKLLQGLITNDIYKLNKDHCLYAAMLTPQGRFLHDFFIYQDGEKILLDLKADRTEDLMKRLSLYKLRSDVIITSAIRSVHCLFGELTSLDNEIQSLRSQGVIAYIDPRLKELGIRIISADYRSELLSVSSAEFDEYRMSLGIPEAGRDMIVDKAILLECGLDELNAIDWDKGCYLGQELNARTKHRGMVRKRFLPVDIEGEAVEFLAPISWNDLEVGKMYSSSGKKGIARIRLEVLEQLKSDDNLLSGSTKIKPYIPDWLKH